MQDISCLKSSRMWAANFQIRVSWIWCGEVSSVSSHEVHWVSLNVQMWHRLVVMSLYDTGHASVIFRCQSGNTTSAISYVYQSRPYLEYGSDDMYPISLNRFHRTISVIILIVCLCVIVTQVAKRNGSATMRILDHTGDTSGGYGK